MDSKPFMRDAAVQCQSVKSSTPVEPDMEFYGSSSDGMHTDSSSEYEEESETSTSENDESFSLYE